MVDKTTFLFQILEDVYTASSLCRPDIEQYKSNKATIQRPRSCRNVKTNPVSKTPYTTKCHQRYMPQSARKHQTKHSKKAQNRKQQNQRRCNTTSRTRAFYKSRKSIQTKCESNNAKRPHSARPNNRKLFRSRPVSAPLKKSNSVSYITNKYNVDNKSCNRKHYRSTTNLTFSPLNKFHILNLNQTMHRKNVTGNCNRNSRIDSFTASYVTHNTENIHNDNLNTKENCLINSVSRIKWIQNYIKDKKANLLSLDEFASLKLKEFDEMNTKKHIFRNLDQSKNKNKQKNIEAIQIKNRVNSNSLRIAMYIDLLLMISKNVSQHSQLLEFITSEIAKYVIDTSPNTNDFEKDSFEISFDKMYKLSSYYDIANYYKQKYQNLLDEIEDKKKLEDKITRFKDKENKLAKIKAKRKQFMKQYFKRWRLLRNENIFIEYYRVRQKQKYLKKWKMTYDQSRIWNLESRIDSLENELSRNEIDNQLYIGQVKDLQNELKQYKEALAVCIDSANINSNCNSCQSFWFQSFHEYINSAKVKHTFIKHLL